MVTWLSSLPAWALVLGWLGLALLVAAGGRVGVRALVPAAEQDHVPPIAAPLMPALGAVFAIFAALTLAGEAGYLHTAEGLVSDEAAAASRLAWAATSPGVDSEPIQTALHDYLVATRAGSGRTRHAGAGDPGNRSRPRTLEREVRAEAARTSGNTGEHRAARLAGRGDDHPTRRVAESSREIPSLYVLTLVAAGLALIVNAGALTFRSGLRTRARGRPGLRRRPEPGAPVLDHRAVARAARRERHPIDAVIVPTWSAGSSTASPRTQNQRRSGARHDEQNQSKAMHAHASDRVETAAPRRRR